MSANSKMLISAFLVAALATGTIGTASAATCWASSPSWNGYWIGRNIYEARTMALRQCQINTPYGQYCQVYNCDY
jgi:hypothetical protein